MTDWSTSISSSIFLFPYIWIIYQKYVLHRKMEKLYMYKEIRLVMI